METCPLSSMIYDDLPIQGLFSMQKLYIYKLYKLHKYFP